MDMEKIDVKVGKKSSHMYRNVLINTGYSFLRSRMKKKKENSKYSKNDLLPYDTSS